jgi:hypothetical protein
MKEKCDKCGGTGELGSILRDRFNQGFDINHMLVAMRPKWTTARTTRKVTLEFESVLLVINRTDYDTFTNQWQIDCTSYYGGSSYVFKGEGGEPCKDVITLNKSMGDMQKDGKI